MDKKYLVEKWQSYLPPKKTKNVSILYKFVKVYENTVLENLDKNSSKILLSILYKVFNNEVDFELSKSTKNEMIVGSFPTGEMIDHNSIMIDLAIPHINAAYQTLLDRISSGEIKKLCCLKVTKNNKEYTISAVF